MISSHTSPHVIHTSNLNLLVYNLLVILFGDKNTSRNTVANENGAKKSVHHKNNPVLI
jgi:hypothetical protein